MRKILSLALFILLFAHQMSAQTNHENSGWFMLLNSTKFNEKWGLHFDAQFRSGDDLGFVKNVLIRPGLTYFTGKNSNVTVGYLLNQTYFKGEVTRLDGIGDFKDPLNEHRIWEQFIVNDKMSTIFATHRFRLEQRFIENNGSPDVFAQRFRYFFRLVQPLQKKQEKFIEGPFVALQNEIFLNLQNKQKVNGSFFDQNRAYLAAGYRFSTKVDIEVGYLNQMQKGKQINTLNNVAQIALYTRF